VLAIVTVAWRRPRRRPVHDAEEAADEVSGKWPMNGGCTNLRLAVNGERGREEAGRYRATIEENLATSGRCQSAADPP
jgi:hypothetical protein